MSNAHSSLKQMDEMPSCLMHDAKIQKLRDQLDTLADVLKTYHREGGEIQYRLGRNISCIREITKSFHQLLDAMGNETFLFILP